MPPLKTIPNALLLIFVFGFGAVASENSRAQEPRTFVIAAETGYGVEECLSEGGECGKAVADAWCESHGDGSAIKFGLARDGGGGVSKASSSDSKPYFITCGD
jgi:hypothetical protein